MLSDTADIILGADLARCSTRSSLERILPAKTPRLEAFVELEPTVDHLILWA